MKKQILWFGSLVMIAAFALACATKEGNQSASPASSPTSALSAEIQPALTSITKENLLQHIKVLASDEFEGRAPGTAGEEKTVNYLTEQFKRLGLKPGNPDGAYTQKVPLVGFMPEPSLSFNV